MEDDKEFKDFDLTKMLFHSESQEDYILTGDYVDQTTASVKSSDNNERDTFKIKNETGENNEDHKETDLKLLSRCLVACVKMEPEDIPNDKSFEERLIHQHSSKKETLINNFFWICCGLTFNDFMTFSHHKLEQHQIGYHSCSVCDLSFSTLTDIENHYNKAHYRAIPTIFKCTDCKIVFGEQTSFFKHKIKCKEPEVFCRKIVESIIDEAIKLEEPHKPTFKLCCCEEYYSTFENFCFHKFSKHKIGHTMCGLCFHAMKTSDALYDHYQQTHFIRLKVSLVKQSTKPKIKTKQLKVTRSSPLCASQDITLQSNQETCSEEICAEKTVIDKDMACTALQDGILCQCSSCSKTFTNFELKNVYRKNNRKFQPVDLKKPFSCDTCNFRFERKSRLKIHIKTHEGLKRFPCDICGFAFTQNRSLSYHKLKKHSSHPSNIICDICNKYFSCKSSLVKHVNIVHLNRRNKIQLKCEYCAKTFNHKRTLERHTIEQHFREEEFICAHCDKIYYSKSTLVAHIRSFHLPRETVTCNICGYVFNTKSSLINHQKRKHFEKTFSCEICGKMFATKVTLKMHLAGHFDEKPYICQICGKGFKRSSNLQQHQYTHSKLRPHECSTCGQTFRLKTHVKQHLAVHGMIKNHKCFICDKMFARKGELNVHLSGHGV